MLKRRLKVTYMQNLRFYVIVDERCHAVSHILRVKRSLLHIAREAKVVFYYPRLYLLCAQRP